MRYRILYPQILCPEALPLRCREFDHKLGRPYARLLRLCDTKENNADLLPPRSILWHFRYSQSPRDHRLSCYTWIAILISPFITPILKSLVVPVIWLALVGAIYSRIAPFFALNRIFFPANEDTITTKQPIRFQGLFKVTNQLARKWKTKSILWQILQLLFSKLLYFSPQKMNEFNFKPAQYCINETFELTKTCIWTTSEWL